MLQDNKDRRDQQVSRVSAAPQASQERQGCRASKDPEARMVSREAGDPRESEDPRVDPVAPAHRASLDPEDHLDQPENQ